MNKIRSLGKKSKGHFKKFIASLNGIKRQDVYNFIEYFPNSYEKILRLQNKYLLNVTRPTTKLIAENLHNFLQLPLNRCKTCDAKTLWSIEHGRYREFCSKECANANPIIVERRNSTIFERFGVMDINQHPDIKKKKIKTFMKNYGVDNPSKSKDIVEKKRQTSLNTCGYAHHSQLPEYIENFKIKMSNPEYRKKQLKTNMLKYGVPYTVMAESVKEKIRATNMRKYGAPNPGYLVGRKIVTDKFGVKHKVQGYERKAIRRLQKLPWVKCLHTKRPLVPTVTYKFNEEVKNYYPDFLLEGKNKKVLVEVKGSWPLKNKLDVCVAKAKSATKFMKKSGGEYWFVYYTDKNKRVILINPTRKKQFTDLLLLP